MIVVLIRAILLYVLIIFSLRLMGKRQLGELQPGELCITILISNIASVPIEDPSIPMMWSILPILVLVGFELIISYLSIEKAGLRRLIAGNPVVIIADGEILQPALKSLRFSVDDLMESLRTQNIFDVRDVDYAIVETSGSVSVLQKYESQPITPKMLGLEPKYVTPMVVILNNGMVRQDALCFCQLKEAWLTSVLKKENISLKDVFLMTANKEKQYYIVKKTNGQEGC